MTRDIATAVAVVCCALSALMWLAMGPPAAPRSRSSFIEFYTTAGGSVTLSIGVGYGCAMGFFSETMMSCPLDKIAELRVDGKVVASINASLLTPDQIAALKLALQGMVDQQRQRSQLLIRAIVLAHET